MKSRMVFVFYPFPLFYYLTRKSIYNPRTLQHTVTDVLCTEAWLHLKSEKGKKDSSELKLQLYRDGSFIVNKPFFTNKS